MKIFPVFLPYAGCPHRCRFCRQDGGTANGTPTPEGAAQALDSLLPASGAGEIAFYGGTFTLLPEPEQEAFLSVASRFVRDGRAAGLRISTRPDALAEPVVRRLARQGVTTVEIGCQSFSPWVLSLCGRGHGAGEAGDAVTRLRHYGLRVGLQLMPGLPGGDCWEAIFSLEKALALKPDFLRIYPAAVFRGTELEMQWRSGGYHPMELDPMLDLCAALLWRCRRAGVPVIRLGLQGTPSLESELLAGPWHPAFGQMVRSRLWLRALWREAESSGYRRAQVHPFDLSDALGVRRENLDQLCSRFEGFTLAPDPALPRNHLRLGRGPLSLQDLSAYEE